MSLRILLAAFLVLFALAVQAAEPVLTTTAATEVTAASAQMNGIVNPMGGTFTVRVEYGQTTSYGTLSLASSLSGTGTQSVGFLPSGLVINTTYHYRIIATDGTNTYVGNDMTFTTLTGAPSVGSVMVKIAPEGSLPWWRTFSATSVSAGSSPATVSYEYGPTTDYGSLATDPTPLAKDSFTEQTPEIMAFYVGYGVTHYRCKVVNQHGTAYSPDMTFTLSEPEVTTTAASGVTDFAATMNGMVKSKGLRINVAFEYGLTTSYGQTVTVISGTAVEGMAVVSNQLQALPAATTYHYRLKVTYPNLWGPAFYGADQTFTTLAAATPPTVGDVTAPVLGVTEAQVACSPVSAGSSAASAVFQYGPTTDYGSTAPVYDVLPRYASGATMSATLSGLSPSATYHVRCVITNAEGTATSTDATFTTAALPEVTTEAATSVGDLYAVLNGTYTPHGSSQQCAVYFEYGYTTDYDHVVNPTPNTLAGAGAFSGSTAVLRPGTTYHYRAMVRCSYLNDLYVRGPDMTFTTAAASTPPTVGDITTKTPDVTAATLGSSYFAGSSMATLFCEYQAPGGPLQTMTFSSTLPLGSSGPISLLVTNLLPDTTYTCRFGITNAEGTSYSAYTTFTTLVGATVTTGAATSVTDVTAVLSGSANANGWATYFITFEVGETAAYGKTFNPTTSNGITGLNTVAYASIASRLLPNTTYHYRIKATQYRFSQYSITTLGYIYGEDQTFTTGAAATPPGAITLNVSRRAPTASTLNAGFETGSSAATVVFEYGTTTAYGSQYTAPAPFAASTAASATCVLQGLTADTTYHSRVTVTNSEGSSTGQDITFNTLPVPTVTTGAASLITATQTTLNGTCNKQGGTYTVTFDYGPTTNYGLTATLGGGRPILFPGVGGGLLSPDVSAQVGSLLPLTTYHFRLKATDDYGNSYFGSDATFATISPVQAWRQQKFSTIQDAGSAADMACPAGDGVPNLLKYALNMDPTKAGRPPQPQLKDYSGAKHLSLTFQRDPAKTDVTYEVQAADSPNGPWTTLASSAGGAATSGAGLVEEAGTGIVILVPLGFLLPPQPVDVEVKDIVSMQNAPRRFMRLQVTRQ